tara:strand:+ start:140 stop:481 length:342 start_codon:yes stop_codon:yes gene_type:complete
MKLTTLELKQIVREELKKVVEGDDFGKAGAGETRKSGYEAAKETGKGGITDQERGIILKLQQQLIQAARQGNIVQGNALRYAKLFSQELEKMIGPVEQPTTAPETGGAPTTGQ